MNDYEFARQKLSVFNDFADLAVSPQHDSVQRHLQRVVIEAFAHRCERDNQ